MNRNESSVLAWRACSQLPSRHICRTLLWWTLEYWQWSRAVPVAGNSFIYPFNYVECTVKKKCFSLSSRWDLHTVSSSLDTRTMAQSSRLWPGRCVAKTRGCPESMLVYTNYYFFSFIFIASVDISVGNARVWVA